MAQNDPHASSPGEEAMKDTRRAASDVSQTLRESAHDAAGKVSAEASRAAHQAQDSAADEVKSVASALRTAADELRRGSPQERTFSQIATGLADASDAIRDKDMGEMVGELNAFARRNPMVFLGGAALLGFAATRFAKASGIPAPRGDTHPSDASRYDYRTGSGPDAGRGTSPEPGAPARPVASPSVTRGKEI